MPSRSEHISKAQGNEEFALSLPLDNQARIDWALVALFYAAMHYVEAYAALDQHLRSHESRDRFISRDSNLRKIFGEYGHLKYFGYNARYEMFGFKATDFTEEAIKDFERIKALVAPLL